MLHLVLASLSLPAHVGGAPNNQTADTSFIVLSQWDGRTFPNVQWALDVSRITTHFSFKEEVKLQKLLPTTNGPAPSPTLTAYDELSRTYFTMVPHNLTSARLWSSIINGNVTAITPIRDVFVPYPEVGATMVGMEATTISDHLHAMLIFLDGTVLDVDPATGATKMFCNLVGTSNDTTVTTAIELNIASNTLYVVLEIAGPSYANPRVLVAVDLHTRTVGPRIPLQHPRFSNMTDPAEVRPFQMVWLESLNQLLVFHTGIFDQLIFTDPQTGKSKYYVSNLAQFGSPQGHWEFVEDERLQSVDTRQNVLIDYEKNLILSQCSDVDPDSGDYITSLCMTALPTKVKISNYVNAAISPMSYGYAGMRLVKVV